MLFENATISVEKAVCPWCRMEIPDSWDSFVEGSCEEKEEGGVACSNCGKLIEVETSVVAVYFVRKAGPGWTEGLSIGDRF